MKRGWHGDHKSRRFRCQAPSTHFSGPTRFAAGEVPFSVAVGDLDGDAIADLAVANDFSDDVSVLLGNGAGGFGPATSVPAGSGPTSVVMDDLNGDEAPDLAVADESSNGCSATARGALARRRASQPVTRSPRWRRAT